MILSPPLFLFFLSAGGWDWKTERSSGISNTRKPVRQENLQMRAGWGRSGCTHDPTCPAHGRPGGWWGMTGTFLCPPPRSHEPVLSPGLKRPAAVLRPAGTAGAGWGSWGRARAAPGARNGGGTRVFPAKTRRSPAAAGPAPPPRPPRPRPGPAPPRPPRCAVPARPPGGARVPPWG